MRALARFTRGVGFSTNLQICFDPLGRLRLAGNAALRFCRAAHGTEQNRTDYRDGHLNSIGQRSLLADLNPRVAE